MACARYVTAIQELVDGTLGQIRRAELEAHLETCEACRALKADIEHIRDSARALGERPVPDRVWLQIAGRLRQEGRVRDLPAHQRRGPRMLVVMSAAAAVLILAIGGLITLLPRQQPAATPSAPVAAAPDARSFELVQGEVDQAQKQMETAIAHMEQITKANQQALDSKTAATLEKNLGIIDQAIEESRSAVKSEPASVAARGRLFDTLKQKVSLLQDTIALMNEMRKGNDAGAAQIVEGINKS